MVARSHFHHWLSRSIGVTVAITALLTLIAPAFAKETNVKLSIKPVGVDSSSYFSITASPGETVQLAVELGNGGDAPLTATTFAADTFTMPNGGFGIQDNDAEQTITTRWITYPTETLALQPGETVIRNFPLTVPDDVMPGDYLTSLVIQNTEPIPGEGAVALNQIVRQAVAISIDVPGERTPALAISGVRHEASGVNSVVTFDVDNPGNMHLSPAGEFALTDAAGIEVDRRAVAMDRFYAGTRTTFAVAFERLLAPGDYYASLTLTDAKTGATARIEESPMSVPVVEVPAALNTDGTVAEPARTNAPASATGGPSLAIVLGVATSFLLLGIGLTISVMRLRARAIVAPEVPLTPELPTVPPSAAIRPGRVKPLISRPSADQEDTRTPAVPPTVVTDTR